MILEAYILTSSVVKCFCVSEDDCSDFYWKMPKHHTKSVNIIFPLGCIQLPLLKGTYCLFPEHAAFFRREFKKITSDTI